MNNPLENLIEQSENFIRPRTIAKNNYGTLIVSKRVQGAFRIMDEPSYMDWQDARKDRSKTQFSYFKVQKEE